MQEEGEVSERAIVADDVLQIAKLLAPIIREELKRHAAVAWYLWRQSKKTSILDSHKSSIR
jgi:hypothetical protein